MNRFVVFACRKCGHNLYAENTEDIFEKIGRVSNFDCPTCGEEPYENWVFVGLAKEFPYSEKGGE